MQSQQDQAPTSQCPPCKPEVGAEERVGELPRATVLRGCPGAWGAPSSQAPAEPTSAPPLAPVLIGCPTRNPAQVGRGGHFLHHHVVTPTGVWQCELLRDLIHACQLSWGQRS